MRTSQRIWRVRLVTASLLLIALCFHQAPGLIVPDTKLDLTANPGGLLLRALSIWDDNALGQLQNQAYGYLFPMGPFHWALDAVGLPSWVVQRLWWSTVLVVALWGFWRLASALDVGTPWARYLGAVLFALSPRFLSEVAITSIEVWPMAMAPWVLLPLVDPAPRGTWSRLSRSAVAFGLTGGVNAVASGAALVLPTLWFATRAARTTAAKHFVAWVGLCVGAALWWLVPLLVLGRYSPPFLDWIEDAQVTTATGSAFNALQGTTAWLGFLGQADGPSWPAAWLLVTQPLLIVLTAGLGLLGLAGLADRRAPERTWLLLSLVVGIGLLTAGFSGAGSGPLVAQLHDVLDGPLAPLRNLHKFELVIRIPLLLGVVHGMGRLWRLSLVRQLPRAVLGVAVALLVVATAAPGLTASLPRPGGYGAIPEHWHQTARWLDKRATIGSVLVLPAASFADFSWGSTKDEPLQALLDKRAFAVRDAVPLGSAGTTRMLDEVERRLGSGLGSPELRRLLNDAGIRYLVVRNDLRIVSRDHGPLGVHEALAESGITRVASFGPPTSSPLDSPNVTLNERTVLPYPSVEVFDTGAARRARFVGRSSLLSVTGGPEDLVTLGRILPKDGAAVLGSDRSGVESLLQGTPEVLTDGLRRREVSFGRAAENTSDVLTSGDPGRSGRRTTDFVADPRAVPTVLRWSGIRAVRASSSASDANATLRLGPAYGPAAALDGDPSTRWVSGTFLSAVGQWLEVDLDSPRDLTGLSVLLSDASPVGAAPTRVSVETDGGTEVSETVSGARWSLRVPPGPTSRVRVRLEAVGPGTQNAFAISELSLPGVVPRARLEMPVADTGTPSAIVMRQQNSGRTGCFFAGERPLCAEASVQSAEEASGIFRSFETSGAVSYAWSGSVLPRATEVAERLLDFPGRITVEASSRRVPALAARPAAVVDNDLGTGWVAAGDDENPTLVLSLPEQRDVTGLQFLVDPALAGSRPTRVLVVGDDGVRHILALDAESRVRLPSQRTRTLTVTFLAHSRSVTIDAATGHRGLLPVGVSELRVEGADDLRTSIGPQWSVETACGFGPSLTVDGRTQQTRVSGTVRQVLRGEPLTWTTCDAKGGGQISVDGGRHTVDAVASREFMPHELVFAPDTLQGRRGSVSVLARGASLVVARRAEPGLLVLPHNFNAGWSATDERGKGLPSIRVNGWQQGWVLPAGGAVTIQPSYAPQRWYTTGLILGAAALLAVVLLAALARGRPGRPGAGARGRVVRWSLPAALGVVLVVNGGLLGAAAGVTALALVAASRGWRSAAWVGLAVAGVVAVGATALQPWGQGGAALSSAPVALAVWTAVAVATLMPGRGRAPIADRDG
jgi:arabinofuranan 3-O-arabinosyltransferase